MAGKAGMVVRLVRRPTRGGMEGKDGWLGGCEGASLPGAGGAGASPPGGKLLLPLLLPA